MNPEARSTLAAAASAHAPLHLIALSHELRAKGHISGITEDSIAVEVGPDQPLAVLHTVSASFSLGTRTWSFLATVLDAEDGTVVLSAPQDLVWADRRLTPRVPVSAPVDVEILGAHPASNPQLVDLALAGMGVRVKRRTGLKLNERVTVALELQGHRVELTAELRRIDGNDLGFFFPDSVRRGRISPPPALVALLDLMART